jgi:hypothetical protein
MEVIFADETVNGESRENNNLTQMDINAVITGDLVKSRRIHEGDIDTVINSLKDTFNDINEHLLGGKGKFEIFRGDSFQGLMPQPELALLVSIIIRAKLRTFEPYFRFAGKRNAGKPILYVYSDARISVGIGKVSYNGKTIAESQGEAFEKSGHALDKMKNGDERLTVVTPWEQVNKELDVECKLADVIISRWTSPTAEALYHYFLFEKTQQELANQLKISQPAARKRLVVYGNVNSINAFINRYKELINNPG